MAVKKDAESPRKALWKAAGKTSAEGCCRAVNQQFEVLM